LQAKSSSNQGVLLLLFTLSGACGLVYEITWTRQLTLIFGLSTYSVITVLSAFMAGLSIGSFFLGKMIDTRKNPLYIYGLIEIGIGLYAVLFPRILDIFQPVITSAAGQFTPGLALVIFRMVCTFLLLLPPTVLMGATFPIMNRIYITNLGKFGRQAGLLYAVNTFGAVLGAFLTGFILLKYIGISKTTLSGVICNLVIGVAALFLARNQTVTDTKTILQPQSEHDKKEARQLPDFIYRIILVTAGISGFTFLAFETLSTRILILLLGNSSWAFSTILCCVLTGIALGSLIGSKFFDRVRNTVFLLCSLNILTALTLALLIPQLSWQESLNDIFLAEGQKLAGFLVSQFIYTFITVIIPSTVMGAVFPLCLKIYCGSMRRVGGDIGLVYAVNTIGAVLGTTITGLFLIPAVGVKNAFLVLILLNLILGAIIFFLSGETLKSKRKWIPVYLPLTFLGIIGFTHYDIQIGKNMTGYRLIYEDEGVGGLLTVFEGSDGSTRVLNINNITEVATDDVSMQTFRMMASVPLLYKPMIENVLVITFGAGIASGTFAELDVNRLDCVEINPEISGAAKYFIDENFDVLNNPRLNLIIEDGRNFLLSSTQKYDLISADATHPTGADSWVLFTREFYSLCKTRLNKNGLMTQWIPLHGISQPNLRTIIGTIHSVFPEVKLWFTGMDRNVGHILIIASEERLDLSFKTIDNALYTGKLKRFLDPYGLDDPFVLSQHYIGDQNTLKPFYMQAPVSTDDKAYNAFPDNILTHRDVIVNLEELFRLRSAIDFTDSSPELRQQNSQYFNSYSAFWSGQLELFKNNTFEAIGQFKTALESNPDNIALQNDINLILDNVTEPVLNTATAFETQKQFDQALELLAKLEDAAPDSHKPFGEIGRIYLQNGQTGLAKKYLLKAAQTNADFTAFFNLGIIYLNEDSLSQAEWAFKESVKLNPSVSQGHANLGYIYHRLGKTTAAKLAWEEALKYDPNDELAKNGLDLLKQQKR